jgi:RNAse (barnase) inhibitor barstar
VSSGAAKRLYEIDGTRFSNLEGFFKEFGSQVIPGQKWGENLDAFDDVLGGGFGTPEEGFVLVWQNSDMSRKSLGHEAMARKIEEVLTRYRSSAREAELAAARRGEGQTVFDVILDILHGHPEVELVLK